MEMSNLHKKVTVISAFLALLLFIIMFVCVIKGSARFDNSPQSVLSISDIPPGHRYFPPNATHIRQLGKGWYVYRIIISQREYTILQHYVDQDRISMTVLESKRWYGKVE